MRAVEEARRSTGVRGARDPDRQPLAPSEPLPPPALPPEARAPASPDLFTIVNLAKIDNNEFVHLLYRALHLREPDQGGLNANLLALGAEGSPQRRESMARSFLASDEFRRGNHAAEAEARRLAGFVRSEFRGEAAEIFADIMSDWERIGCIWDQILSALFAEDASFLKICQVLGRPEVNNGWIGKIEGTELSGVLPAYSIKEEERLTIIFNGRADDVPLEQAVRSRVGNGSGTDLYLVKIDLADHYNMSGTLHSVSIAVADGTVIAPSPIYVYGTETRDFHRVLDEVGSGSYGLFSAKPFRKSSSSLFY
jgi:uncharacterized protein DUF4214